MPLKVYQLAEKFLTCSHKLSQNPLTPALDHSVTYLSLKQNKAFANYNRQLAEKFPDVGHKLYLNFSIDSQLEGIIRYTLNRNNITSPSCTM